MTFLAFLVAVIFGAIVMTECERAGRSDFVSTLVGIVATVAAAALLTGLGL